MSERPKDTERVQEMRRKLQEYDTEYLSQIWRTGRADEWTPEAWEVIRQILTERTGSVPERMPEVQAPEAAHADTYHDRDRMMGLALRLQSISWIFLLLAGLSILSWIAGGLSVFNSLGSQYSGLDLLGAVLGTVFRALESPMVLVAVFFLLRAAGEGLLLLMDIEDNTRHRARL